MQRFATFQLLRDHLQRPHWKKVFGLTSLQLQSLASQFLGSVQENDFKDLAPHQLSSWVKRHFTDYLVQQSSRKLNFDEGNVSQRTLLSATDLRSPHIWLRHAYQSTELGARRVVCHMGPTNSGKSYHAIQILARAPTGIYAAPLRLLADEMYKKLNGMGVQCALVTGEARLPPCNEKNDFSVASSELDFLDWQTKKKVTLAAPVTSCTVEMVDMQKHVDVAVLDEIQMCADTQRGWAFTHALLSLPCRELHLCGEPGVVPLIKRLLAPLNENLIIHQYERLKPLKVASTPSRHLYEKGDCYVTFSRNSAMQLKHAIEKATGKQCAIIYGSLPMETRQQQAKLFNENENVDFLVATDAIGMGMNLNVRRMIFTTLEKINGQGEMEAIPTPLVKQIAGRAGRFSSDAPFGVVTTLLPRDLAKLHRFMNSKDSIYQAAGVLPLVEQIEALSRLFPDLSFSQLFTRLEEWHQVGSDYFLCDLSSFLVLGAEMDSIPLSLKEKYIFCSAPVKWRDEKQFSFFKRLLKDYAERKRVALELEWPRSGSEPKRVIAQCESIHAQVMLYLWLSQRFPISFCDVALSSRLKRHLEFHLQKSLECLSLLQSMRYKYKNNTDTSVVQSDVNESVYNARLTAEKVLNALIQCQLENKRLDEQVSVTATTPRKPGPDWIKSLQGRFVSLDKALSIRNDEDYPIYGVEKMENYVWDANIVASLIDE